MSQKKLWIPKIIHQIWLGSKPPPTQWMQTWPIKHPDWEYKLWTEANLPKLRNQRQFDAIQTLSGKADIARIEILHEWGGVYLDADCECLRPLDDPLRQYPLFTCYENEILSPGLISTVVIGCKPKHELMSEVIQAIAQIEDVNQSDPWNIVGPFLFTRIARYYEIHYGSIKILPSYRFLPIHYWGMRYQGRGKVYATHHWSSTFGKPYEESKFNYEVKKT